MLSFNEYVEQTDALFEDYQELTEALITFGGQAYPKFGNIVIMAGGAGSGKGFVKSELVGLEGKTFDVDELKSLSMKSPKINARVKDKFGVELDKLNLKTPEDVFTLHTIIGDELGIDDRRLNSTYRGIMTADPERKPNLIFDVTLKDLRKLQKITSAVKKLGYKSENIHIVWVINDIEVAKKQNAERARTVPVEILVNTHRGVSHTMHDILQMGKQINRYMDGDIVFAFNKVGVDADLVKSGRGGKYIKNANYFYVKKAGKQPLSLDKISDDLKRKISSYVPKDVSWED